MPVKRIKFLNVQGNGKKISTRDITIIFMTCAMYNYVLVTLGRRI